MTQTTMETVTFKLRPDADVAAFVEAAKAINTYVAARDGFIARRLSRGEDGTWIEQIEWATLAAAKSAAADLGKDPTLAPFLSAIDGPSATVYHTAVEITVN